MWSLAAGNKAEGFQTHHLLQKSCEADTRSLEVLVCPTAMMRRTGHCTRLQGVSHVRKAPLSERAPLPDWRPWAPSLQGWQTGALCREPAREKQHGETWLKSKMDDSLREVKSHILLLLQVAFPQLSSSWMDTQPDWWGWLKRLIQTNISLADFFSFSLRVVKCKTPSIPTVVFFGTNLDFVQ